jgi:hypothetical protein
MLRTHIDRCPGCAAFEDEVRRQRAAFAAIMPVAPTMGLKASVLALFGGGGAAAAGGVGAGAVAGSVAAGGTTVGLASLGAKGIVTKVLAAVAISGGATHAHVQAAKAPPAYRAPAKAHVEPARPGGGAAALVRRIRGARPIAAPVLRQSAVHKHHSPAVHKVTTTPLGAPPSSAPAAPATVHPAPAPSDPPASTPPQAAPSTSAPAATAPSASTSAPQAEAPAPSTSSPAAPAKQEPAAPAAPPRRRRFWWPFGWPFR